MFKISSEFPNSLTYLQRARAQPTEPQIDFSWCLNYHQETGREKGGAAAEWSKVLQHLRKKINENQSILGSSSGQGNLKKACSQCYNSFTGLYLQVCKTGLIIKINSAPACCQIQFVDACFHFEIPSSLVEKHDNFELDNTCGLKWLRK